MLQIEKIPAAEWAVLSETAHLLAFQKNKPASFDRIDYALLATLDDVPAVYVQCRELDHESVYWQFGGGFPWASKSMLIGRAMRSFLAHEKSEGRKRISVRIENSNTPMLRLALGFGWKINGTVSYETSTLVMMTKELTDA